MKRILLLLFIGLGLSLSSWAQGIQLSGVVSDQNGGAIDNFPVHYAAYDSLTGLVDSGTVVTNPNGFYNTTVYAAPNANTNLQIFWFDCNGAYFTANYFGDSVIVHNISTCAGTGTGSCDANFTATPLPGLPVVSVAPDNFNPSATYEWSMGDGTTSNTAFFNHTYAQAGTYNICLIATSSVCADTVCQSVVITGSGTNCNAHFITSNPTGNSVLFTNLSSGGTPMTTHYFWDFGDGNVDSTFNPSHTYAGPGQFLVCLTMITNSCVSTFCDSVIVGNATGNCQASFTYQQQSSVVNFTGSATGAGPFTYTWDLGDGTTSSLQNPVHTYPQAGVYIACLTITDSSGCAATYCEPIIVQGTGAGCDADFTWFNQPSGPLDVAFAPNINATYPYTWSWDFGDGNTSTALYPIHTYGATGSYEVCFTISDTTGCTDTFCDSVFVGSTPGCAADVFVFPDTVNPLTVHFSSLNQPGVNYSWDFGDGNSGSGPFVSHTYAQPDSFVVCLTTLDSLNGCSDTFCFVMDISVTTPSCDASFAFAIVQPTPIGPTQVNFFPVQSNFGASFFWDFGDGNTSNQAFASHSYAAPGTYTVCLYVTGLNGCSDTSCQTITLTNTPFPCNADFFTAVQPNNVVDFAALYPADTYLWDFGDGTSATTPTATHAYAAAGTYNVCLTVTDSTGCVDSLCQSVTTSPIVPPPGFAVFGQVWAGNQVADDFTAWLVVYDSAAGTLAAVDTFVSDSSNFGFFFFTAPNGDYRVKASLNSASSVYSSYLPTYYGNELFWDSAIVVNQNTFPLITIDLISGNNPGGPGFIGGLVSQGANKTEGDPMAGMHVLVTDENNDPVAHATTDENGEYAIGNLPYGTYHVWVEMWGRELNYHQVTLSPSNPGDNGLDFEVTDSEVIAAGTTSLEDWLTTESMRVYPNPTSNLLNLEMSLKQTGQVELRLENLMGQTVLRQGEEMMPSGLQNTEMNVSSLSNGIYLLQVSIEGQPLAPQKVVIQR